MTYAELVEAVQKLPVTERLALMEVIVRSLRQERRQSVPTEHARGAFQLDPHRSVLDQLHDIIRPLGQPPDDAAVEAMIADYLAEKYR
jgi:hypothetical protein